MLDYMNKGFDLVGAEGAEEIGDVGDIGKIFSASGELFAAGAKIKQDEDAKKQSAADIQKSLDSVLEADRQAAQALARAIVSKQLKSDNADTDEVAAKAAVDGQDIAAADLSPDVQKQRMAAARKAQSAAIDDAGKNPKDGYKKALVSAWTTVVNKANSAVLAKRDKTASTEPTPAPREESWLTKKVVGPIPGYGVLAGASALAVVGGLILKNILTHAPSSVNS